ncbi:Tn7-like element transposition protein TnsE [Brevibacillus porteri]|uniref:Tn7-like element transposition protein TnsE n=1 Tax=Brevibacillus porteri TaxID=2126350 RepID=UPI0036298044
MKKRKVIRIPVNEVMGGELFFRIVEFSKKPFLVSVKMSVIRVPPGNSTFYVVEVARPDKWSISTLILRPSDQITFRAVEQNIKQLLDGLIRKGVHWDQNILSQCSKMNIEKLKHYQSDTIYDWVFRIAGKFKS